MGLAIINLIINKMTEKEIKDLQSKLATVTSEKEELASKLATVTSEKEELSSKLATVTSEKEELSSKLATVTSEKEELASNASKMVKDDLIVVGVFKKGTGKNQKKYGFKRGYKKTRNLKGEIIDSESALEDEELMNELIEKGYAGIELVD